MKKKNYLFLILILSIIGFTSGLYLKFIRPYSEDKLQVETTNFQGENIQRQLKLGEYISMLNDLETIAEANSIESKENDLALKILKTINIFSIILMILCCLVFLWSVQQIIKINRP